MIYSYDPKDGAQQSIMGRISDICISMKASDYLQLPDCIIDDIPVELDAKAKKAYNQLERDMVLALPDGDIDVASAAGLSNKLQQLANGAVYDDEHGVHEVHNCKLEAFLELLEKLNGQHALVFYNFKHDLSRIQDALKTSKLRVRVFQGAEEEKDWNSGKIDVLWPIPLAPPMGSIFRTAGITSSGLASIGLWSYTNRPTSDCIGRGSGNLSLSTSWFVGEPGMMT